ncbi:MAG: DUF3644 domain-containing protein [Chloroflexaceae bacterium]
MSTSAQMFLERAVAAMVVAIDAHNRPGYPYRGETFAILALNAWELLLKARWIATHSDCIESIYERDGHGQIKQSRSGNPRTLGLNYLAQQLAGDGTLHHNVQRNLELLAEVRNAAVHFYHQEGALTQRLQELSMACVRNFVIAVQHWFQTDLTKWNLSLMPLSFLPLPSTVEGVRLHTEEEVFLSFLNQTARTEEGSELGCHIMVQVEIRFIQSEQAHAVPFRVTDDPDAPVMRLTDDQIREMYPWDYKKLTKQCQQRYSDFKVNDTYHKIRKRLESDGKYCSELPQTVLPTITDFRALPGAQAGRCTPELEDALNDASCKRDWLRERRIGEGRKPTPPPPPLQRRWRGGRGVRKPTPILLDSRDGTACMIATARWC